MNKKIKLGIGLTCLIIALLFSFCSRESHKSKACYKPAFKNVDIKTEKHSILAEKGGSIKIKTGTTINIPPNSFIDEKGNAVKGNVEISYREFHNSADILISGIPMQYDSAGISNHFETAGMFEINGFQEENPVYIAKDKHVSIKFASAISSESFNFYQLDTVTGNWEFVEAKIKVEQNPNCIQDEISELKRPVLPRVLMKNDKVIDLNINFWQFPEMKSIEGLMWVYNDNNPKTDPDNNKWVYTCSWTNISISMSDESLNQYKLELKQKDKAFTTYISPVLSSKDYEKSKTKFENQMKEYNKQKEEILEYKNIANIEESFLRSFEVNSFGVYNCDRIYSRPDYVAINPILQIDGKKIDSDKFPNLCLITASNRSVIRFNGSNLSNFGLCPSEKNTLIAILPENKIAILSSSDISKLKLEQYLNYQDKAQVSLNLKTSPQSITSKDDVEKILNSI